MLRIIISSCTIILIMFSSKKIRSLPILASVNHMMVVEEKLPNSYKTHKNSNMFWWNIPTIQFSYLGAALRDILSTHSGRYYHALPFIDFWTPVAYILAPPQFIIRYTFFNRQPDFRSQPGSCLAILENWLETELTQPAKTCLNDSSQSKPSFGTKMSIEKSSISWKAA